MIDSRYYTVIASSQEVETLIEQNIHYKKQNKILGVSIVVISIAAGIFLYWNHLKSKEKNI